MDDISIPAPRVAKVWYCSNCGEPGGVPEEGYYLMDRRFAVGVCDCTHLVRGKRPRVQLVADFHFSKEEWQENQQRKFEKAMYEKELRGSKMKPLEAEAAARYRVRIGVR